MKNPKMKGRAKESYNVEELFEKILDGDRWALSKALTLVESQSEDHLSLAADLTEKCLPHSGNSYRLGITGSPGVGKSTFIERMGTWLIEQDFSPAILAVDPSSSVSRGSLLGDKTRMSELSKDDRAYIRPTAARDTLGGVAHATQASIVLCEAAGFDPIMIETVGVGQSETLVKKMVDFFILLILPGSGDDLQGIKRGIVELADLICINKSDGERAQLAKKTKRDFQNALHLFRREDEDWNPQVINCSALEGTGITETWELVNTFYKKYQSEQLLEALRKEQDQFWLEYTFQNYLERVIKSNPKVFELLQKEKVSIREGKSSLTRSFLRLKQSIDNIIR